MKLPVGQKSGITTMGATGITLMILASLEVISIWWLVLGIPLILGAIGSESSREL